MTAARLAAEALALFLYSLYDDQRLVTAEHTITSTTSDVADTTTGTPVDIRATATYPLMSKEVPVVVSAASDVVEVIVC